MRAGVSQPLLEGSRVENFVVRRLIARGAFSFVYLVHGESGTPFALKEYFPATLATRDTGDASPAVAPEHSETFRLGLRCFLEEARVLARLSHRNVVRVLSFLRANDTAYLAMRYERGRTLLEHIQSAGRPLAEGWIRETFAQLLEGLQEVHSAQLLHLDIKPQNLLIRNDGTPVLIDFGAARRMPVGHDPRLPPVFTPGFAPAELHQERAKLGPWSDIYSIGACLYGCVCREAPPSAVERAGKERPIGVNRRKARTYSADLLDTIDWCLRQNALERPQSVRDLQQALRGERAQIPRPASVRRPARAGLLRFAMP